MEATSGSALGRPARRSGPTATYRADQDGSHPKQTGSARSARLMQRRLAPATVLQIHRILSRALKVAMQRGYITRNVATLVDAPSVSQAEIEPLTLAEAQRITELAANRRNGTRWNVALALPRC